MSTVSSNVDLNVKYQRVVNELAKLRNQVPILKNAVIEEKAKTSQLSADANTKETALRKLRSENESLAFRNEQLLKRVESLQDSLEHSGPSGKSNKADKKKILSNGIKESLINKPDSELLEQELKIKLDENVRLHSKIFDLEASHLLERNESRSKISFYESELEKLKMCMEDLKQKNKTLADANDRILVRNGAHPINSLAASSFSSIGTNLAQQLIYDELGHGKTVVEQKEIQIVISQLLLLVKEFARNLGTFFTLLQQRSTIYPQDMTMEQLSANIEQLCSVSIRASEQLDIIATDVERVQLAYDETHNLIQLKGDSNKLVKALLDNVTQCDQDLVPLLSSCIDLECRTSWCDLKLEKQIIEWRNSFAYFIQNLYKFLVQLDMGSLKDIAPSLLRVTESGNVMAEQFVRKIFAENQLPISSKKFRCVNDCLQKSIQKMSRQLVELQMFADHNLIFCITVLTKSNKEDESPNSTKGADSKMKKAIKEESSSRSADVPEEPCSEEEFGKSRLALPGGGENTNSSVEASVSGSISSTCDDGTSDKYIRAELSKFSKQLIEAEKEKDRCLLEIDILKMKMKTISNEQHKDLDMDNFFKNEEIRLLFNFYSGKLDDLYQQLHYAQGRAVYYKNECENLVKKHRLFEEERAQVEAELAQKDKQCCDLRDDLESTRRGYEEQMKSMCEHLATLNAKVESQSDTIAMFRNGSSITTNSNKTSKKLTLFK